MKLVGLFLSRPHLTTLLLTLTFSRICGISTAAGQSLSPVLFVCHNIATSPPNSFAAVSSFTISADGTVHFVGNYYTNDNPQAIAVSPNGRYLAVTHGTASTTTEDLLVFRIEPDASLTMLAVYATPDSPLDVEWLTNDVVACTETSSSGANRVHVYRLVESNPIFTRLTLIDSENAGLFTAYLQRDALGRFLYASDSDVFGTNFRIRVFTINPDGTLTLASERTTTLFPLDMAVTHDGRMLYSAAGIGRLSGGDSHRVHGFSIDQNTGGLSVSPGAPYFSANNSPAHVAVTGDDGLLLVGHGGDGDIRSFLISPEDGFLTDTGNVISIGNQGDIGAITTMQRYLFATRRYGSTGNPSGLLVYRMGLDGTFNQIGGLIDVHGNAPDAVAAWRPAAVLRADINGDGVINDLDIAAFVAVLMGSALDPSHVARSDLNGDQTANGLDLPVFVSAYLNPNVDGACCASNQTCTILSQLDCEFLGNAVWLGPATTCSQCPLPPPTISEVFPDAPSYCNGPGSTANFTVLGSHFSFDATTHLRLDGEPDILPSYVQVFSDDGLICGFNLNGAAPGLWDIVVINPDNQSATGPTPYLVEQCP